MAALIISQKPKKTKKNTTLRTTGDKSENKQWIKAFFQKQSSADANDDDVLPYEAATRFKEQRKNAERQ